MLSFVASKCTECLVKRKIIDNENREVYNYGFQLLFSTTMCVSCILVLGAIFDYMLSAIVFLASFVIMRLFSGGYHAKTYGECFIGTNIIAISCIMLSKFLWNWGECEFEIAFYIFYILCVIYIGINTPIISNKSNLTLKQIDKKRQLTR